MAAIAAITAGRAEIAAAAVAAKGARIGGDAAVIANAIVDRRRLSAAAFGADVDYAAETVAANAAVASGPAIAIAAVTAKAAVTCGISRSATDVDRAIARCGGNDSSAALANAAVAAVAASAAAIAVTAIAAGAGHVDPGAAAVFVTAAVDADCARTKIAVRGVDRCPAAGTIAAISAIIAVITIVVQAAVAAGADRRNAGAALDDYVAIEGKDVRTTDTRRGSNRRCAAAQPIAAEQAVAAKAARGNTGEAFDRDIAVDRFNPGECAAGAVTAGSVIGIAPIAIGRHVNA